MSAIFKEQAAPPTPNPGYVIFYAKADHLIYFKDDTGTEYPVKPTGGGTGDLLSDGSVPLSAPWDVGAFVITALQLESDVTTGTPPFIVASTTLVPNLNAEMVGGTTLAGIQTLIDTAVAGLYDHKGDYDADTNSPDLDTSPSGIKQGDVYAVSVAGTFFTADVQVGDTLIAKQDDPVALDDWSVLQTNLDAPTIATLYESNLDTNKFTDAEKTSVAGALQKAGGTMSGTIDFGGFNLINAGVQYLTERASADSDAAGKGQIWVKNTTPCELWFTDDAGTDIQLGVGGGASTTYTVTAAVGDDSTDNTTVIQGEIDAIATAGGGTLFFPEGVYQAGALTWKDRVTFQGANLARTVLKLKDGVNGDFITTDGYASLVSTTNQWLVSEGVLSFIGLKNIQINGNKANQSAGDGLKSYAKGIFFENVIIRDCYGNGWLSYGGDKAGQTDWYDLPEGRIDGLALRNNGGHGWHCRGPHDVSVDQITINGNGGNGLHIERSTDDYNGQMDIGIAHVYANTGYGVYTNTAFRARQLISESNEKEGLFLDGAWQVQISLLQLYNNCRTTGTFQLIDTSDARYVTISQCLIRPGSNSPVATGGAYIQGDFCMISDIQIIGSGGGNGDLTGIGFKNASTCVGCVFSGIIRDMEGTGAIGLQTNGGFENTFNFLISNCKTLWNNATTGTGSVYNISGRTASGQTHFSGNGPNVNKSETWNATLFDDSAAIHKKSRNFIKSAAFPLDASAGTSTNLTVTHNLLATPLIESVQLTISATDSGGGTSFGGAGVYVVVQSISSTQIVCKVVVDRPGAAGSLGYVHFNVRL